MERREIQFWRRLVSKGRLIEGIRRDRDRAVRFFGAKTVASEDELGLRCTLDAYEILAAPHDQLESEVRQWARIEESDIKDLHEGERASILARQKTVAQQISDLKARAQRTIQVAMGKE